MKTLDAGQAMSNANGELVDVRERQDLIVGCDEAELYCPEE